MQVLTNSLQKSIFWIVNDPMRWLRPLLIIAVLLVCIVLPFKGSMRLMQVAIVLGRRDRCCIIFMAVPRIRFANDNDRRDW